MRETLYFTDTLGSATCNPQIVSSTSFSNSIKEGLSPLDALSFAVTGFFA